jgi:hypothetical protein
MKPTHDLAVKTGTYTDKNGEKRNRYLNVGKVFRNDDGGEFIAINRTFNPAGVPNPDGKEMVVISKFEIKDQNAAPAPAPKPQPKPAAEGDDGDIPF